MGQFQLLLESIALIENGIGDEHDALQSSVGVLLARLNDGLLLFYDFDLPVQLSQLNFPGVLSALVSRLSKIVMSFFE